MLCKAIFDQEGWEGLSQAQLRDYFQGTPVTVKDCF